MRGNAFSTAVIILQARKKRIAFRHSHFLIHNVIGNEININTLRDPQKINKERERLEKSQVVICKIFSDRTNLTLKQIKAEFAKNQEIGADEALGLGLINEVV